MENGDHHILDPGIDEGNWCQGVHSKVFVPVMPKSDWHSFQSQDIPMLFNYEHVHHYVLESIQVKTGCDENGDGLVHMTDKPLKNGRKYVDSEFIHDMMDT